MQNKIFIPPSASTKKNTHQVFRCLMICFVLFLFSCSTTKYIPEGQYLLDKISMKTDSTEISKINLEDFIRQKPNSPKIGLKIYNLVDNDATWFKKIIRKLGEPPVIYNQSLVSRSVNELSIEMKNRGFLNSRVHAVVDTAGKKISVDYHLHEGIPYRIRNYTIALPEALLMNPTERPGNRPNRLSGSLNRRNTGGNALLRSPIIKPGTIFDMDVLEQEMTRISNLLRNRGYYALTAGQLRYLADTTLRSNQTDLTMILNDTTIAEIYRMGKVKVFSGYDPLDGENYRIADSIRHGDVEIYYDKLRFLRPAVIADKVLIRPGSVFRDRSREATQSLFQSMACVGKADIIYKEGNYPDSTLLDCEIYLTPGDIHSIQTGLSGTNKAGDMGVAFDMLYGHQNLLNGAELFNIGFRAAYEFVGGKSGDNSLNSNYYELRITPSFTFPKIHLPFIGAYFKDRYNGNTQYSLGFDIQKRPEFTREFFNFNWQFRWSDRRNVARHTFSLLDVNYVAMPWKSEDFQQYLEKIDPLTKYSYENVFTAGINYNFIYTNARSGRMRQRLYTVRFNFESSGNLLNGIASLMGAEKSETGYMLFGNPFAQYLKSDVDFSETIQLNTLAGLAFHAALGLAYPYGNSNILPFEKRYYAGGPNSVRGWHTRYLGPGSFNEGVPGDPTTHVGDINLVANVEYRYKVLEWFEPAFFVDCGNIWTIRDYPNQRQGLFRWDSFYKELAVGTGIGLRFDLGFFIFRIDAGTRVYDPACTDGKPWVFLNNQFGNNSAAYLAIGYPF
ncbi:MAG: outer membrane protein assembly factor [Dysgonamonadaceae bacterium]|nr:outer membrane protein assembly factor [Dysgonamonadaceae bacterium]